MPGLLIPTAVSGPISVESVTTHTLATDQYTKHVI